MPEHTIAILGAPTTSPCATCVNGCCYRHTVNLGGYDAWVIARGLQLAPAQFLQAVPLERPEPSGFLLAPDGPSYQIALARRPGAGPPAPCMFLIELPDGAGRCGIYTLRPLICQTYPAYTRNRLVGRRDDVLCPSEAWRGDALAGPEWYAGLARQDVEQDIYELAVARWDYQVLYSGRDVAYTLAEFLDYLVCVYERLEPVRALIGPAEWPALCAQWERCIDRGVSPLHVECPELQPWATLIVTIRAVVGDFFADDMGQHLSADMAAWEADRDIAMVADRTLNPPA